MRKGIFKEVGACDLEQHTQLGWALVESFDVSCRVPLSHGEVQPADASQGRYSPMTNYVTRDHIGTERRYLLARDEDSAIAKLAQDVLDGKASIASYADSVKTLTKERDEAVKAAADSRALADRTEEAFQRALDDSSRHRATISKLETHIGRLREEIGAERFRKIVGDA